MNAYSVEQIERIKTIVTSTDLTLDERTLCANMLDDYAKLVRSRRDDVTDEAVEKAISVLYGVDVEERHDPIWNDMRNALLAVAPLLRGKGGEAVAELIMNHDMKGCCWFDIKLFDKTLPNGTKLYTTPQSGGRAGDPIPDGSVLIEVSTLKWWLELVTLNPFDLSPRIAARIEAARRQPKDAGK